MSEHALAVLGSNIRARRKELSLTQEELADLAGLDRSYMGGVERGERNITVLTLCKICAALSCDLAMVSRGLRCA